MPSHEYFVEMIFAPFASPLSPEEAANFAERQVLPTLEACQKLREAGRIVAGGPPLASTGLSFIARAESPEELESLVGTLPLWPRSTTRVVPLGTFESRATTVRRRLDQAKTVGRAK